MQYLCSAVWGTGLICSTQLITNKICCLITVSCSCLFPLALDSSSLHFTALSFCSLFVSCVIFLVKGRKNGGSLSRDRIGWAGRLCQSARPTGSTAQSRNPPWQEVSVRMCAHVCVSVCGEMYYMFDQPTASGRAPAREHGIVGNTQHSVYLPQAPRQQIQTQRCAALLYTLSFKS